MIEVYLLFLKNGLAFRSVRNIRRSEEVDTSSSTSDKSESVSLSFFFANQRREIRTNEYSGSQ